MDADVPSVTAPAAPAPAGAAPPAASNMDLLDLLGKSADALLLDGW